jgi:hypothetical protein
MPLEHAFLAGESALETLIHRWREGTLPGPEFNHAAHLAACAWLTFDYRGEALAAIMKRELIRYNEAVGGKNTDDSGYHETLTRFWCSLVEEEVKSCSTRLAAARAAVTRYGEDRNAAQRYYSFDVLKSREARRTWIAPDLQGV